MVLIGEIDVLYYLGIAWLLFGYVIAIYQGFLFVKHWTPFMTNRHRKMATAAVVLVTVGLGYLFYAA